MASMQMEIDQRQLEKPCVGFFQAGRIGRSTAFTIGELVDLLHVREPEQLALDFTETNRPISDAHIGGIADFLVSTPNWAIPPIVLAVDPKVLDVQDDDRTLAIEEAVLRSDKVRILDGQHRIQGFAEASSKLEQSGGESGKLNDFRAQDIPVVIFEVESVNDQRQMFAWFARNKPISSAVREWFDPSDPFSNVCKRVMTSCDVLKGRVEIAKNRLNVNDKKMMTLVEMRRIALAIAMGISKRPVTASIKAKYRQPDEQEKLSEDIAQFFDEFLPSCRDEYEGLDQPDINFAYKRQDSFAYEPLIVRLLSNVWARWVEDENRPQDNLAEYLRGLNFKRSSENNDLAGLGLTRSFRCVGVADKAWEEASKTIIQTVRDNDNLG